MIEALHALSFCIRHRRLIAFLVVLQVGFTAVRSHAQASPAPPRAAAVGDMPAATVQDYRDAAAVCPGLSWTVLAGIGKVESDHGRSTAPGVRPGANYAGAMGPMQFLASTWNAYGQGDVYDHRDASFGAARYLCSNGAGDPARLPSAIWHYNHDWGYVASVQGLAGQYAAAGGA